MQPSLEMISDCENFPRRDLRESSRSSVETIRNVEF